MTRRLAGIVWCPRPTFEGVAAAPRLLGALTVPALAAAAAGALLMQTDVGQQALVDQWERTALAFGRTVGDAEYARFQELAGSGWLYSILAAVLNGPVAAFGVALLIVAGLSRAGRAIPSFRQVLAVAAHGGVILALRQIVAAPLGYVRETTASATAVGVWFPLLDEASPVARLLSMLDLFVLWWIVVLAIGTSVLYRRPVRTLAGAFVGAYVAAAALLALVMAAAGGTG